MEQGQQARKRHICTTSETWYQSRHILLVALVFGHIVEDTYNFFIGDSINTLTSDASSDEKAMAALSFVPSFKFLKFAKYGDELTGPVKKAGVVYKRTDIKTGDPSLYLGSFSSFNSI